jgi:hypothetical protein
VVRIVLGLNSVISVATGEQLPPPAAYQRLADVGHRIVAESRALMAAANYWHLFQPPRSQPG